MRGEQVRAAEPGQDAELHEGEAELRLLAGDADVEGQDHRDAHADRRAVHRRDQRLRIRDQLERKLPEEVLLAEPRALRGVAAGLVRLQVLEVDARAEAAPGAGEDHRAHGRVLAPRAQHRRHLFAHLGGVGVQLLGPVQRERADAVRDVGEDVAWDTAAETNPCDAS